MSDRIEGTEVIQLLPEELITDPELARPEEGMDEQKEVESIDALAKTITRDGQLQPVLVREVDNGGALEYHIIAGHRRTKAIAYINMMQAKKATPVKVLCSVVRGVDANEAYRKSLVENIHRENLNPMQLAATVQRIKGQQGWKGSKEVAEFLGVSRATVTQHEKLFELPEEIRKKVADRTLAAQSAFDLLSVKPEKREEVIQKAGEKAQAEADKKAAAADDPKSPAAAGKAPISREHVISAARESDALEAPKPRTRKEILEWFTTLDSPEYGYANGAVRTWVNLFVDSWCKGVGTDRNLMKKFDAMVANASKGTESKKDRVADPEPEPEPAKAEKPPKTPKAEKPKATTKSSKAA